MSTVATGRSAWRYIAGAYIGLCLVLGGSSMAGALANATLQVIGLALLVVLFWTRRAFIPAEARPLLWIGGAFLAYVALSLVPLPGAWDLFPLRGEVARGLLMLDIEPPPLPLTLDPQATLISVLWFIPPTTVFLIVASLRRSERRLVPTVILVGASTSAILGAFQLIAGADSPLRLYSFTTPNRPVGFFANSNHEGTLLLCALVCAGYIASRLATGRMQKSKRGGGMVLLAIGVCIVVVGIALSGSMAVYGIFFPAALTALLIYRKAVTPLLSWRWKAPAMGLPLLFVIGSVVQIFAKHDFFSGIENKVISRSEIAQTTMLAIQQSFPVGTGLGSFPDIYRWFESPTLVLNAFVNHAHNDYLEVVLELGAVGALLVIAFVVWWGMRSIHVWEREFEGAAIARAGAVIVGIVLLHSFVDYPIRTSAIAAVFASACALMVSAPSVNSRKASVRRDQEQLRHARVG